MTALAPPVTSRQAWTRLALLATALAMALGTLVLSVAWLWPQTPSRIVEVPLDSLEIGVPEFIRPFNMGGKDGHSDGIWLVRLGGNRVVALWSRPPHPAACSVTPANVRLIPAELRGTGGTPTIFYPSIGEGDETVPGFHDPCFGTAYLLDGTRSGVGAPFQGLDRFPTVVSGATIEIDLAESIAGVCYPESLPLARCSTADHEVISAIVWPRA